MSIDGVLSHLLCISDIMMMIYYTLALECNDTCLSVRKTPLATDVIFFTLLLQHHHS